jgi:hypothetical protein
LEILQRKYFEENKHTMIRARNPISGEATPREGRGEPILNPEWKDREVTIRKKEKPLTEKIGAISSRYDCLGNSAPRVVSQSRAGSRAESRGVGTPFEETTAIPQSSRHRVPITLPTPKCAPQNLKFDPYGFVIDEDEYA